MGAHARITMFASDEPTAHEAASAAFQRMDEIEAILSDYRPDSEAMVACRRASSASTESPIIIAASETLFRAVEQSLEWSARTEGAFDITVGPTTALWREARQTGLAPDPNAIAVARRSVGWTFVDAIDTPLLPQGGILAREKAVPEPGPTLIFRAPNMRLDFGGIGKGLAADEALAILHEHGIASALIDLGGDFAIGEAPPGRTGWTIEIRTHDPDQPDHRLVLADCAMATSGDLEQFIEYRGRRYSHIIDPHTGYGLTNRAAATVIASDATTADVLASAACVLGVDDGIELIRSIDRVEARIVQLDPDGLRIIGVTPGFYAGPTDATH